MDTSKEEIAAVTRFPSPINTAQFAARTRNEKVEAIAGHVREIMAILGLDLENDSLKDTPTRVAAMYVDDIFAGLDLAAFPKITMFENNSPLQNDGHLVVTRVSIVSFCEHHLVPMIGYAYIAYLPKDEVIGLSKLSRIARYFAARPQLQERLTAQIGDSLATLLGSDDVAVLLTAQHTCVVARGAKDESSETTTMYTSGIFKTSHEHLQQFLGVVRHKQEET